MLQRLSKYFKTIIARWLGVEELCKTQIELAQTSIQALEKINQRFADNEASIKGLGNLLHIGMDIASPNTYDQSWVVVCVKDSEKGIEVVQFYELTNMYAAELNKMLEQMQRAGINVAADTPRGYRPNPRNRRNFTWL